MDAISHLDLGGRAYRMGVILSGFTVFLIVWTTIVRDDGNGIGYFMAILAAAVGAFATRFEDDGLARTMMGVALMHGVLGLAIATAPITATIPEGQSQAIWSNALFAALWLLAGASFRLAATRRQSGDRPSESERRAP